MTWEANFRQSLLGRPARNMLFYEGAGCRFILGQIRRLAFADTVRLWQARERLKQRREEFKRQDITSEGELFTREGVDQFNRQGVDSAGDAP